MRRILNYTLLITLMLPLAAQAQETQEPLELSLEESVRFALKNQVKMKNARLTYESSMAQNREVTGLALPQLSAKGNINYAPLIAGFIVPDFTKFAIQQYVQPGALNQDALASTPDQLNFALQPKWTTTATAEVSQILFEPSVFVALQARKALEKFAEQQIDMTETELTASVTKTYYNVLIAEKRMALIDKNVERIQELFDETKKIYEVGLAEKIDADRVKVTLNNLKTQQTKIKQLVEVAYMSLKFQIGMALDQPITLTDGLNSDPLTAELLTHTFDHSNRIEYQILEQQGTLLKYDEKRYKLGQLPTLTAFGNYGYTLYNNQSLFSSDPNEKWQDNAMVGVQLSVPLFDGFQRRNKRIQATIAYQKNRNDLHNLKQGLELEAINARIALRSGISNLKDQEDNMQLAEEVYNIARAKYKEGVGSSLEIMDAETSLKEAQTNYFNALYEAITARIDLLKALGEL